MLELVLPAGVEPGNSMALKSLDNICLIDELRELAQRRLSFDANFTASSLVDAEEDFTKGALANFLQHDKAVIQYRIL